MTTATRALGTIRREDADEIIAGLDLRIESLSNRIDEGSAYAETIMEARDPRIDSLTALIPRTKEGTSEITHITKGQYRKVWGREPKANTLTADGKAVRWEYALDEIAQELGLEGKARDTGLQADEYLKNLIEEARETKREVNAITHEVASDQRTLEALEKLKASVRASIGPETTFGLVESYAKPKVKPKTRPERKAQKMLADEAWKLIKKIQAGRSPHAIAMDSARKADRILPLSQAHIWAKNPNRYDIRGVDTPARKRPKPTRRRRETKVSASVSITR